VEQGDRHGTGTTGGERRHAAQSPPLRRQLAVGAVVVALSLALLGAFGVLGAVLDVPYRIFTKKIAEQFVVASYTGLLAHITWFLWVVAGTSGLLAAAVLRRLDRRDRRIPFFLGTSLLTAVLLLDDFAMLHEQWLPRVGIPEEGLYVFCAVVLVLLLVRFRGQFAAGGALLAVAAGAFWATSLGADFVQEVWEIHATPSRTAPS
jgi:hypothetical protein